MLLKLKSLVYQNIIHAVIDNFIEIRADCRIASQILRSVIAKASAHKYRTTLALKLPTIDPNSSVSSPFFNGPEMVIT